MAHRGYNIGGGTPYVNVRCFGFKAIYFSKATAEAQFLRSHFHLSAGESCGARPESSTRQRRLAPAAQSLSPARRAQARVGFPAPLCFRMQKRRPRLRPPRLPPTKNRIPLALGTDCLRPCLTHPRLVAVIHLRNRD